MIRFALVLFAIVIPLLACRPADSDVANMRTYTRHMDVKSAFTSFLKQCGDECQYMIPFVDQLLARARLLLATTKTKHPFVEQKTKLAPFPMVIFPESKTVYIHLPGKLVDSANDGEKGIGRLAIVKSSVDQAIEQEKIAFGPQKPISKSLQTSVYKAIRIVYAEGLPRFSVAKETWSELPFGGGPQGEHAGELIDAILSLRQSLGGRFIGEPVPYDEIMQFNPLKAYVENPPSGVTRIWFEDLFDQGSLFDLMQKGFGQNPSSQEHVCLLLHDMAFTLRALAKSYLIHRHVSPNHVHLRRSSQEGAHNPRYEMMMTGFDSSLYDPKFLRINNQIVARPKDVIPPDYLPPEALGEPYRITATYDSWGMGVTFLNMLTATFNKRTFIQSLGQKHGRLELEVLKHYDDSDLDDFVKAYSVSNSPNQKLVMGLKPLFRGLLRKDPKQRFGGKQAVLWLKSAESPCSEAIQNYRPSLDPDDH